jgi:ribosome-associated protein
MQVLEVRIVKIREEPVELFKLLKIENLVASGGEAKFVIAEGMIRVNGEVELRKRKKIYAGDEIFFQHYCLRVVQT